MEYGGTLVDHECGALGTTLGESDVIDDLLVEGCWVEASDNNLMAMMQPPVPVSVPVQYMGEGEHFNHQIDQCAAAAAAYQEESGFVVGKRWWIGPRAPNPGPGGPSSSVKERLVVAVGYLKEYTKNSNNVLIQIWVPLRRRGLHNHYHYHTANPVVDESVGFPNPNINVQVRFFRSHEYPRVQPQQHCQYGSLALPVFERGSGTCLGVLEVVITNQTLINYRPQLDNHLSNALEAVDFRGSQNMIPPAVKVFDELYQAAVNEIMEVLASVCKTHNLPLALTWAPCIQQGKGGCGVSISTEISSSSSCVSTVDSACFVGDVDVLGFQEACYEYHLFHGQGIVGTAFTTTKPCFAIDITAFSKAEYPLAHHAKVFGLHAAVAIPLRSVYTGSAADFVLEFFLPKECRDSEEQKQMLNSLSLVVQQACRSLHLHVVMEEDDDQYTLPTMPPPPPSQSQSQSQSQACSSSKESSCSWIAHMMEAQHKGKGVSVSLEYLQEPKEEFKVTTNWEREGTTLFSEFGQVMEQSSNSRASVSVEAGEESAGGGAGGSGSGRRSSSSGGRKSGDKRRTKAEKTISLPVLRQYFAGSLKDAAKSIGVCPTTLKRICRQHGITRWPSRKIKKVGHSLKKLQLVIDSVQGAEGAIQIGSFYASFPELSSATHARSSNSNPDHHHNSSSSFYRHGHGHGDGITRLKSPSSACSSFAAATTTTTGNQQQPSTVVMINNTCSNNNGDILMTESTVADHTVLLRRAHSEAELQHAMQQQEEDTKQYNNFNSNGSSSCKSQEQILPPTTATTTVSGWKYSSSSTTTSSLLVPLERGAFRVKATFADEKIRFSMQSMWRFRDLQHEIARRFNLNDMSNLVLKYLDDEGEWVVLGCDADLDECKDLHTTSHTRTIRLSLFQASPLSTTFRSSTSPS